MAHVKNYMKPSKSEDQNMELLMSTLSTQKAWGPLVSAHEHSIQLTKTDFVRPRGNNLFCRHVHVLYLYHHLIPKEPEIALGEVLAYTTELRLYCQNGFCLYRQCPALSSDGPA